MISNDHLVSKIFDAVNKVSVSREEKRRAIIRAGLIAQAYNVADEATLESVFGPLAIDLDEDKNSDSIRS